MLGGECSALPHEFTEDEAERHNALTKRGWNLSRDQFHLHDGGASGEPGYFTRRKLRRAIKCFEEALLINPGGWSSMWALGKIYQRLGQHQLSLDWFSRAIDLNPGQPDVAREAGLAALDSGEGSLAVQFCSVAVANKPDDPGLVANLALAHMLRGDDTSALECANRAVKLDVEDQVSRNVLRFVESVASGTQLRPRRLRDAFPN